MTDFERMRKQFFAMPCLAPPCDDMLVQWHRPPRNRRFVPLAITIEPAGTCVSLRRQVDVEPLVQHFAIREQCIAVLDHRRNQRAKLRRSGIEH